MYAGTVKWIAHSEGKYFHWTSSSSQYGSRLPIIIKHHFQSNRLPPFSTPFLRFALELRRSGLIVIEGVRCKLANDQFKQFEMDDRQAVKSEKMKSKRNGKRCENRGVKSTHLKLFRVYVYCHPLLTSYASATFSLRFTSLCLLSKSIQEEIVTSTIRI